MGLRWPSWHQGKMEATHRGEREERDAGCSLSPMYLNFKAFMNSIHEIIKTQSIASLNFKMNIIF